MVGKCTIHSSEHRKSEHVCIALVIHNTKRMRRIILYVWPLGFYHIFPHYLLNGKILENVTEHKIRVSFTNFV